MATWKPVGVMFPAPSPVVRSRVHHTPRAHSRQLSWNTDTYLVTQDPPVTTVCPRRPSLGGIVEKKKSFMVKVEQAAFPPGVIRGVGDRLESGAKGKSWGQILVGY